ncbi:MAG: PilT protein domain protein [uncultured Sulfurovum sp.]|uniref:PilT protein domain protein n=1 Tax=uncultured Sulfurovum sp. TaxID=269237 RepID=A0A6S6TDA0_9BACT|nr:MAG: PilT protein domain protein [uncultured Sulfurovum sp.]
MIGIVILINDKFLFDTNIIIYYFNGITIDNKIDQLLKESFNISIITKIEFLSWQKLREDKALEQKALAFISHANVYELTDEIANKVIDIRQKYKVKTPDAIIGATALVYGFDMVTNNVDDFKNLDLEIVSVDLK